MRGRIRLGPPRRVARIVDLRNPTAVAAGCPSNWKDMLVIAADRYRSGPAQPMWPGPVTSIHVCVFDRISTGPIPVGQFRSGHSITGSTLDTVRAALDAAPPAAVCTTPHTAFAVLTADNLGGWAMVELDGGHRLLRTNGTLGQLDANTINLLTAPD